MNTKASVKFQHNNKMIKKFSNNNDNNKLLHTLILEKIIGSKNYLLI